ncbi:MAG: hypothetical protein F6K41_24680 [Symploca sp. SIO3E6]|nr:hypothetical protein [Caldora sp. SIO3E6]
MSVLPSSKTMSGIQGADNIHFQNYVSPFGRKLIQLGYIESDRLEQALVESYRSGRPLTEILELITGRPLSANLRHQYKQFRLFQLKVLYGVESLEPKISQIAVQRIYRLIKKIIPIDLCYRYRLVPLCLVPQRKTEAERLSVVVAMVSPDNLDAQDRLHYILQPWGLGLQRVVITGEDYQQLISLYLEQRNYSVLSPQQDSMEAREIQPRTGDLVLGSQVGAPEHSVVLGGLEGIEMQLASSTIKGKITALLEATRYGAEGWNLVIQSLKDESEPIQQVAEKLLLQKLKKKGHYQPQMNFLYTLRKHSSWVESVAISSDGQAIVSTGLDNTIRIWDLPTGQELRVLWGNSSLFYSLALSPDGQIIVSGSWDNTIRVWDFETGQELYHLKGHTGEVDSLVISPDSQTIISGSRDNTIRVWNLPTGQELRSLQGHTGEVYCLAISPDGRTIVSGSRDNTIRVWDLPTGQEIRTLNGHTDELRSVAISPDGQKIVSGSRDNTIRVWDLPTGKELRTLNGHLSSIQSVAIDANEQTIVSGSRDKTVRVWNLTTGEQIRCLRGHTDLVRSVDISLDGQTIVSGSRDNTIRVWGMR